MANRVLLNSSGFKVSKPGVNVLSAAADQLQYSSDWSALSRYQVLEFDCNWTGYTWMDFAFSKTFATPPIVHAHRVISASEVNLLSPVGTFWWKWFYSYTSVGITYEAIHEVEGYPTTTGMRVRSFKQNSPAVTSPDFRIRCHVFDYNL